MARGQNLAIPASGNVLIDTLSREVRNAAAILNPNDGVLYVRLNSRITDINSSSWDWKLPSQSYGIFPGPWQSLGLYYLDQSGASRPGEVTVYDSDIKTDIPDIHSIGRSLQAQSTALDLVEGAQPTSPALGLLRLYADVTGHLGVVDSTGIGRTLVDSATAAGGFLTGFYPNPGFAVGAAASNIGGLGGVLSGSLPNPGFAAGVASANIGALGGVLSGTLPNPGLANPLTIPGNTTINGTTVVNGDIRATRGGAAPGSGVLYFGDATRYIYFDGSSILFNGSPGNFNTGLTVAGPLVLPASSILAAMIASGQISRAKLASDSQAFVRLSTVTTITYSVTATGGWVVTPLVGTFVLGAASWVVIHVSISGLSGTFGATAQILLATQFDTGGLNTKAIYKGMAANAIIPVSLFDAAQLAAGSHTINVWMNGSAGTLVFDNTVNCSIQVIELNS